MSVWFIQHKAIIINSGHNYFSIFRKGFYCSEVSRGRKLQGACRKQQNVGEKCMNDYHCQEGHMCLKKNNGYE